MKNKALIAALLVALFLIGGTLVWSQASGQDESGLKASGTVEGTEIDINSKIPGRIQTILVSEGDTVKAGQVIARISSDELKAKELQAKALVDAAKDQLQQAQDAAKLQEQISNSNILRANGAMSAAQAQLDKAKKGARSQEVAQAQANYDLWVKTFGRVERLYKQGAVPGQKLDEVKTQLEVARQTLSMAKEGARSEDIRTAQAMVEQAQSGIDAANASQLQTTMARQQVQAAQAKYEQALGGLKEVQAYLQDTELKAPISGTITSLNSDPGELVSSGMPVATITDTKNLWVEVQLKETELNQVKQGQQAALVFPAIPGQTLKGKLVRISKKPDFATKRATNDKGEQDVLSYGVKISISNPDNLPAVGLTANVIFSATDRK